MQISLGISHPLLMWHYGKISAAWPARHDELFCSWEIKNVKIKWLKVFWKNPQQHKKHIIHVTVVKTSQDPGHSSLVTFVWTRKQQTCSFWSRKASSEFPTDLFFDVSFQISITNRTIIFWKIDRFASLSVVVSSLLVWFYPVWTLTSEPRQNGGTHSSSLKKKIPQNRSLVRLQTRVCPLFPQSLAANRSISFS